MLKEKGSPVQYPVNVFVWLSAQKLVGSLSVALVTYTGIHNVHNVHTYILPSPSSHKKCILSQELIWDRVAIFLFPCIPYYSQQYRSLLIQGKHSALNFCYFFCGYNVNHSYHLLVVSDNKAKQKLTSRENVTTFDPGCCSRGSSPQPGCFLSQLF